jgi:ABC-type transporter Mla MlaB component
MLKITEQRGVGPDSMSLILEGRLAGPWVVELHAYVAQALGNRRRCARIDLGGVTFIDAHGKALLARLWREGAELRASGCLTRCVVEEIVGVGQADQSCKNHEEAASKNSSRDNVK